MKYLLSIFLCLILLCSIHTPVEARDYRIVAVVGSQAISSHDVENRYKLALFASGIREAPGIREKLLPQVEHILIDEALYREEAKRLGYDLNDVEITRAIRRIEQRNNLKIGSLDDFLKSKGIPMAAVRDQITAELLRDKIISRKIRPKITITEQDVNEGVERLVQNAGLSEVDLSEIILPITSAKEEAKVKPLADKLVSEINAGGDFESIARQFSQSITASGGGHIGWIEQNQLAPEIIAQIRFLKAGDITLPIRTAEGYQILKINNRRNIDHVGETPETYDIRQAFFEFTPNLSEQDKLLLTKTLNDNRNQIKRCDQFESFATEHHSKISPERTTVQLKELNPQVAAAIQSTALGKTSNLVRSNDGLHLFMVCDKVSSKLNDEQRNKIRDTLYQQQLSLNVKRYLQTLRRNTFIEIRD